MNVFLLNNLIFLTIFLLQNTYSIKLFNKTLKISDKVLIAKKLMNKSIYKKHERPDEYNTTMVMVYIKILAIDSVDVRQMQFGADIYLRQVWVDNRLAWENHKEFKHVKSNLVSPALKEMIWLPDLFFRNGKKGYVHSMTTPNYLMRVKPNGEVLYSQKLTMVFSCQMELQAFPMDTQQCVMDIGSYGYTLTELMFYWRINSPIEVLKTLEIPEFYTPFKKETIDCSADSSTSTGNYTCLKAIIVLKRQLGSYLASTYVPSCLIIMVSWVNFWISIDSEPARITLGLLSMLGIVNQSISLSNSLPKVAYIKAIDVWLIACIIFVIAALLEFAIATTVAVRSKAKHWKSNVRKLVIEEFGMMHANLSAIKNQNLNPKGHSHNKVGVVGKVANVEPISIAPGVEMLFSNIQSHNETLLKELNNREKSSKFALQKSLTKKPKSSKDSSVDRYSRYVFPTCFFLYNIFYWAYYMILINYYDDNH